MQNAADRRALGSRGRRRTRSECGAAAALTAQFWRGAPVAAAAISRRVAGLSERAAARPPADVTGRDGRVRAAAAAAAAAAVLVRGMRLFVAGWTVAEAPLRHAHCRVTVSAIKIRIAGRADMTHGFLLGGPRTRDHSSSCWYRILPTRLSHKSRACHISPVRKLGLRKGASFQMLPAAPFQGAPTVRAWARGRW